MNDTTDIIKPKERPNNPCFSSGPCAKMPNWSLENLKDFNAGRSHRSSPCKAKLKAVIEDTKSLLKLPEGYKVAIVPGSDTGAIEMAMWSMLGERGVDVLNFDAFSSLWAGDILDELGLKDVREFKAPYGKLPDLSQVDTDRDVVFVWNGTTSGAMIPNGDWIKPDRKGLTICDATSSVFAVDMPWDKLDVVTFSWQKVLGGEGAHGMLILSPNAIKRIETYDPERPIPRIFRFKKGGKINEGIFEGLTINTPSMLCVEDILVTLKWVKEIGGAEELYRRTWLNYQATAKWVAKSEWIDFSAKEEVNRSRTSVCFDIKTSWFKLLSEDDKMTAVKKISGLLDKEKVAHDISSYPGAPIGLRVWMGAMVETSDLEALFKWLDWAYEVVATEYVNGGNNGQSAISRQVG